MMFGRVVEEPLTDEYIKKNIDDVSSVCVCVCLFKNYMIT